MSRAGSRFIIVDDDPEIRFFVRAIILKVYPDAAIAEATTGEEGLEHYNQGGADLMVIDQVMPLLNGTDLVRQLRARDSSIPLMMISSLPQVKEQAMAAGATCFLDKSRLNPDLGYYLMAMVPKA
jgi:CheY-like chemotaxis protein